jgi:hypothetical protein
MQEVETSKEEKNGKNAKRKKRISEEETFSFSRSAFVPCELSKEIVQLDEQEQTFSRVHLVLRLHFVLFRIRKCLMERRGGGKYRSQSKICPRYRSASSSKLLQPQSLLERVFKFHRRSFENLLKMHF